MNTEVSSNRTDRLLRPREAAQIIGLATSTIRSKRNPASTSYDPTFPLPVRIGRRAHAYRLSEIEAWLVSRKLPRAVTCQIDGTEDAA